MRTNAWLFADWAVPGPIPSPNPKRKEYRMKQMIAVVLANVAELTLQLTKLSTAIADLDDLTEARAVAEANLASVQSALADAKAALADATSDLSAVQVENVRNHDREIFARTKDLADLIKRTRTAQSQFDTIAVELRNAEQRRDAIAVEMGDIRKRLA
jgi:chromosome segregation ATPase